MKEKAKKVTAEFSSQEAGPFSNWLTNNLDRLFEEYQQSKQRNNGD